ncbi:hypothetical protein SEA_ZETA1847_46 [Microbacterium phage Zeta1847]|uniref:Uncharacterized protein n=1 Tax=Microbacterium phage Zeta1847 TaxID=2201444 RepID=A0A2Z4Q9M2_9CAUD|nr:hypothetical protein HOT46_gp46 [Microbacterium phage Zeta1847]AWY06680.1 hypothetical protein SEA_ZETA1847_46 [Microbacterium phage Zeta1847]
MSTLNPDVIPWEVGGPVAVLLWAAWLLPIVARYTRARRAARKAAR